MVKKENVCDSCGECSCNNEKPLRVRFCPECKSTDVKFVFKLKNLFGVLPRIECNKCGNNAVDFPVMIVQPKKKVVKVKKSVSKKTKIVRGRK